MAIYAFVSEKSKVRLWGLDAKQRLRRQLYEVGKIVKGDFSQISWVDRVDDLHFFCMKHIVLERWICI